MTSNLVYIITCRTLAKPDAGLGTGSANTSDLSQRKLTWPVAKHFSSPGHTTDDMMVAVVRAGLHNTRDRRRAEGHLIINAKLYSRAA